MKDKDVASLKLDLLSISFHSLRSNVIADLPSLKHFKVNGMAKLADYERYVFNSTSLTKLSLEGNRLLHRDSVYIGDLFYHCPNLQVIVIKSVFVKVIIVTIIIALIAVMSIIIISSTITFIMFTSTIVIIITSIT